MSISILSLLRFFHTGCVAICTALHCTAAPCSTESGVKDPLGIKILPGTAAR